MRVIVLGFDGLDPEYLNAVRAEHETPGFDRLESTGAYSTLDSTVVPISAMAWSSFLTGANPGKHGVFDFTLRDGPESDDFHIATGDDRQMPGLWDYLNERGYRVGVLGVPLTYPAPSFDGFCVSGYPTPELEQSYTPPSLFDDVAVGPQDVQMQVHFDGTNREEFLDDQFRYFDALETLYTSKLDDLESWDVLVSVFKQTDDIAHVAWDSPELDEAYLRADSIIETTLDRIDQLSEDVLLFVLSDHGFGPVKQTLFPNNILADLGHLTFKDRIGTRLRRIANSKGWNLVNAYRLASWMGLGENLVELSHDESRIARGLLRLRKHLFLGPHDINTEASDCYSRGNYGQLFTTSDPETPLGEIARRLEGFELDDGTAPIETVHISEEVFEGEELDRAPALLLEPPNYDYLSARGFALGTDEYATDHILGREAEHKQTGVLFARGPSVTGEFSNPSLMDLLPSILYALGEPHPGRVDGSAVAPLLDGDTQTTDSYEVGNSTTDVRLSDDERQSVESQLESLGYKT